VKLGSRKIRLLEAASWLGRGLDDEALQTARATVVVPMTRHEVGPWEWLDSPCAVGLLILEGRIARGLRVEGTTSHGIEMLGAGDLLRPWTFEGESSSFPASEDWTVLSDLECAVLNLDYVKATLRWPRIGINLLDSVIERSRSLSYLLTARQAPRLEARILLTLWHLADRWGRVNDDGVVLDLPKLTHEMIANMIAARRPSVTSGLRRLRDLGLVDVQSRGRWLLRGDPASALELVSGGASPAHGELDAVVPPAPDVSSLTKPPIMA
jgi:CRP/FNR family transcriptional regulator, cyclic AMP receptor protein